MKYPILKNVETCHIIEIFKSPFSVGRSLECDYVIENKIISRKHFELTCSYEGWSLTDSSTNGTLVNDGHYKGETSPILKNYDEISLGYQSYTYQFLIEVDNVAHIQVERLRRQECNGPPAANVAHIQVERLRRQECNGPPAANDSGSSPGTPNSFDENGISDEVLNNLADDILNTVQEQADHESGTQQRDTKTDVSSKPDSNRNLNNCGRGTPLIEPIQSSCSYAINLESQNSAPPTINEENNTHIQHNTLNLINPTSERGTTSIESMQPSCSYTVNLKSQNGAPTSVNVEENNTHMQHNTLNLINPTSERVTTSTESLQPSCSYTVNLESQNGAPTSSNVEENNTYIQHNTLNPINPTSEENAPSQSNSSSGTVIYSLPDEMITESSATVLDNNQANTSGPKIQQNESTNNIQVPNTITNLKESKSESNAAPEPPDHFAETIEAVIRKYAQDPSNSATANTSTPRQSKIVISGSLTPTTMSLASPLNSNKKIKVMALNSGLINQLVPVTAQIMSAYKLGGGKQGPVVRMVTRDELQKLVQNFPPSFASTSRSATANSAGQSANYSLTPIVATSTLAHIITTSTLASSIATSTLAPRIATATLSSNVATSTIPPNMPPLVSNLGTSTLAPRIATATLSSNVATSTIPPNMPPLVSNLGTSTLAPRIATATLSSNVATSTIPPNMPPLVSNLGTSTLAPSVATSTGQYIVGAEGNVNDVLDCGSVPAAVQEVVIDNTMESTGDVKVDEASVQMQPTKSAVDSQEPNMSKALEKLKADNQNQFEEMENELLCTICANLFIKAITLGCSHSFCQYCINQWKKKKTDCPICRTKITSTIRTLVLDNIIEKMLENTSETDKLDRKAALDERNKMEEEETNKNKQTNARGRNMARRGRRGGGNNRGNASAGTYNQPTANPVPPPAPPVITIADSPSTTDNDSDDLTDYDYDEYHSDDWYNGRRGAYYGGYGSCFNCGDRGHWANGCPYR